MSKIIASLGVLALFGAIPAAGHAQDDNCVPDPDDRFGVECPPASDDDNGSDNMPHADIDQEAAGSDDSAGREIAADEVDVLAEEDDDVDVGDDSAGREIAADEVDVVAEEDDDVDVVRGGDVGGARVQSVTLARTGFDTWVLALIGGVSLAGGLGLLAAHRRGRPNV